MTTQTAYEKIQRATDAERLSSTLSETLGGLSDIREWAEALSELADIVEEAEGAVEEWSGAEGREEKADAKEAGLEVLSRLIEAWDGVTALCGIDGLVEPG